MKLEKNRKMNLEIVFYVFAAIYILAALAASISGLTSDLSTEELIKQSTVMTRGDIAFFALMIYLLLKKKITER